MQWNTEEMVAILEIGKLPIDGTGHEVAGCERSLVHEEN
jgi:hypothetical protein